MTEETVGVMFLDHCFSENRKDSKIHNVRAHCSKIEFLGEAKWIRSIISAS
jgi:hypothetical protein